MTNKIYDSGFNSRGQIFSTDLIVASTVFLLIFSLSIVYSNGVANRAALAQSNNLREEAVVHAANSLLYSPGSPANWHNLLDLSTASSIGFAKTRNVIDKEKLERLAELDQAEFEQAKNFLGLSRYELKVFVFNPQNNQSLEEFGFDPKNGKNASTVNRFALFEGKEVVVRVAVFEK